MILPTNNIPLCIISKMYEIDTHLMQEYLNLKIKRSACGTRRNFDWVRIAYRTLQWRYNECDGVSNHWRLNCLPNRLFRRRSKKTSKLRFTGLCEGNSPVTGGFPAQRTSDAEKVPFDDVIMKALVKCPRVLWQSHGVIPEYMRSETTILPYAQ